MGDFNLGKIEWKNYLNTDGNELSHSDGLALIDIMQDYYMVQFVYFPTQGPNTLDLIISNLPGLVTDCFSPGKLSDHDTVACTLNCAPSTKRKPKRKVYLFGKDDYNLLRHELKAFKDRFLHCFTPSNPIERDWSMLKEAILNANEKSIPSKTLSGKDKLPWLTNHLRLLIRRKNSLHTKYKKTGSKRLLYLWKKIRRQLNKQLHSAKNNYINNIIGDIKTNSRPFWRYIRSQRKDNQSMPPLKNSSGRLMTEDRDKFQENFSQEDVSSIPFYNCTCPRMPEITVSDHGRLKLLIGLNISKAIGPDEIHPRILKEAASEIAPVLKYIFQKSLTVEHSLWTGE